MRLAGYDIAPDARLRLRGRTRLMFGREAAVVLGQMDGRATIRELASRNGLALFAMMDWAARLIQDGVCAITSPEHTARRPPMPVRRDNPAVRRESAAVRGDSTGVQWTSPDLSLLGRVPTKLRQLD
ncbi:MAG: hypothetical protein ABSB59_24035 [Streptosporangiaceae bacterium]